MLQILQQEAEQEAAAAPTAGPAEASPPVAEQDEYGEYEQDFEEYEDDFEAPEGAGSSSASSDEGEQKEGGEVSGTASEGEGGQAALPRQAVSAVSAKVAGLMQAMQDENRAALSAAKGGRAQQLGRTGSALAAPSLVPDKGRPMSGNR